MRDFSAERNVVEVLDGMSGDVHEIYYRRPTNEELAAYQNGLFARRGRKVKAQLFETRLKFAKRVITGFKKGTFGVDGKPFSADADDPDYRKDWLALMEAHAADVLTALAVAVFEGTGITREDELDVPLEESIS